MTVSGDMNGNRYKSSRRPPWPQNDNSQPWQVRSNVSSFGYRRHELNDKASPSASYGQDDAMNTVRHNEDDNDFGFRRQQQDNFPSSRSSYGADYEACEQTYPASRGVGRHRVEHTHDEVHDFVEAAFDTNFRLSSSPRRPDDRRCNDPNWNPYRALPSTAVQQRRPPPILKNKISNPWNAEECSSGHIARRDTAPAQVRQQGSANVNSFHVARAESPSLRRPPARAPPQSPSNLNVISPFSRGLLPTPDQPPIPSRSQIVNSTRSQSPIPVRPRTPGPIRPPSPIRVRSRTPGPTRSQSPVRIRPRTPGPTRTRSPSIPARPRTPHPTRPYTPARTTCPDEIAVWETPPPCLGSQSYFESLKNREQQRNSFDSSHVTQGSFSVDCPPANSYERLRHRQLNFLITSSDETPTFTDLGGRDAEAHGRFTNRDGGPENASSSGFQGTWRGAKANRTGSKARKFGKHDTAVNGTTFEAGQEHASRTHTVGTKRHINDARLILDRKRKSASEVDSEENIESSQQQQEQQQPANHISPANTEQFAKKASFASPQLPMQNVMGESEQQNMKLWAESDFSEEDPAVTHAADIHEVDESRLLPSGIQPEAINHVVFLDIDKRSFFEEIKQPFLSGTLLYLFYGDASVFTPTKEHLFYKDNRGCWIHFYPDCGTEYGSYLVAAPAVINWMDQKLPEKVRFLIHGHQKLLHLEPLSRKVIYYPTSRTLDVQLLNRMLKGDFDSAKRLSNAVASTAMKTIVIRSAAGPPVSNPSPTEAARKASALSPSLKTPATTVSSSVRLRTSLPSPPVAKKHKPILAPGQSPPKPPEKQPRQKVLWDL